MGSFLFLVPRQPRSTLCKQDKSFTLSFDVTMILHLPPTQYPLMASHSPRLLSLTRRAFSSSSSLGGVSMVQGASRGIGLEFVRFFSFFSYSTSPFAFSYNPGMSTLSKFHLSVWITQVNDFFKNDSYSFHNLQQCCAICTIYLYTNKATQFVFLTNR